VSLLSVGISHKTAPIEVREKLAFPQAQIPYVLKALAKEIRLDEVALLSTCNRTEFYCAGALEPACVQQLFAWWQANRSISFDLTPYLYAFSNEQVVKHVMRVASGVDSMIIGEPQILGQLKSAFFLAHESGVLGKRLSRLSQLSFAVAKKTRSSTGIADHPVSVAYAAVTLAKQIFSDLSQTTVLLLGAGESAELTLQHLVAKKVKNITILNRTVAHAQTLAEKYGAKAQSLETLGEHLAKADIVISAMSVTEPLLTPLHVPAIFPKQRRRPLLMVDLGVPRNIAPLIGQNEDIYLYTVDDLQGIVLHNRQQREKAAHLAEALIVDAADTYMAWMHAQNASVPLIRALREDAQEIKNDLLNRAMRQLDKGEDPRLILSQLAHQLTQKLMHNPTEQLRKYAKSEKVS